MSSSSYCHGLQSCLKPSRFAEPRVLRLRLSPPNSENPRCHTPIFDSDDNHPDGSGWSFLQYLDGTSKSSKDGKNGNGVYIPPSIKRSVSMLSAKSLEMCTESLGSETGGDASDGSDEMIRNSDDINGNSDVKVNSETETPKLRRTRSVQIKRSASFPPPLSSMSGSTSVQVRSQREGGKLVLEAVSTTACRSYFQAERVNGRLKLHLLRNCSPKCENKEACIHGDESEFYGDDSDEEDEVGGEENGGEDDGETGKTTMVKAMTSRCMECGSCEGKPLIINKNWKAYCVAT